MRERSAEHLTSTPWLFDRPGGRSPCDDRRHESWRPQRRPLTVRRSGWRTVDNTTSMPMSGCAPPPRRTQSHGAVSLKRDKRVTFVSHPRSTAIRRDAPGRTTSPGRTRCPQRPASRGTIHFPHRQGADAGAERPAFPVEPLQPQAQTLAHRQSAPPRLVRRGVAGSSPSWPQAPAGRTTVVRLRPDPGKPSSSPGSQREARHQTHPTNQTPAGSEGRRTRALPSRTPQRLVDSRSRKSPAPASRSPSTQSSSRAPSDRLDPARCREVLPPPRTAPSRPSVPIKELRILAVIATPD
jgi:hypothetical protein